MGASVHGNGALAAGRPVFGGAQSAARKKGLIRCFVGSCARVARQSDTLYSDSSVYLMPFWKREMSCEVMELLAPREGLEPPTR